MFYAFLSHRTGTVLLRRGERGEGRGERRPAYSDKERGERRGGLNILIRGEADSP